MADLRKAEHELERAIGGLRMAIRELSEMRIAPAQDDAARARERFKTTLQFL